MSKDKEQDANVSLDFTSMQINALSELDRYFNNSNTHGRKYTKNEIRSYLEYPSKNSDRLREASVYISNTSSHYFRLIRHMTDLLTLDYTIMPKSIDKELFSEKALQDSYNRANDYMLDFNVKHELRKILLTMMVEDVYFGYERKLKDSTTLQRLPTKYCKITGIKDGLFTFSFNFAYFDGDKKILKSYPSEFTVMYNQYKKDGENWKELDDSKAICFKFREDLFYALPPFVAVLEDILELEEIKDLQASKNKLENFKLLLQKIPFKKDPKNEKDFLISLPSVRMFHEAVKKVLPSQIGLISTPMEIEDFNFEPRTNKVKQDVNEAESSIFNSSGVSSGLFNSGNNSAIALRKAIATDESMMFSVLRQFERFFNKRLKSRTSKKYRFKVVFPDLTIHNRDEMLDKYLKVAQYGFPKSFIANAMGISSSELVDMCHMENDFLGLEEMLIPLNSSHTQNANSTNNKSDDKGGREEIGESKLSDAGATTKDKGTNEERDALE